MPTIPLQPITTATPSQPGPLVTGHGAFHNPAQGLPSPPNSPTHLSGLGINTLSSGNGTSNSRQSTLTGSPPPFPLPVPPPDDFRTQPWRYEGYPLFSEWMGSDDDFFVLRKFSTESARVALWLQDRISLLSERLSEEDKQHQEYSAHSGCFRDPGYHRRSLIMSDLANALDRYHQFVLRLSELRERPEASNLQVENVKTWLDNHNSIEEKETAFVRDPKHRKDLMSVVYKRKPPLRRLLDHFKFVKRIPFLQESRSNRTTIYNRENLIDKIVYSTTTVLGLGMLLAPLWLLQSSIGTGPSSELHILTIVTAFIVAFAILLSLVAVAQPFEVLAATAAYSAVLMVYLQINGPGGPGGQ